MKEKEEENNDKKIKDLIDDNIEENEKNQMKIEYLMVYQIHKIIIYLI